MGGGRRSRVDGVARLMALRETETRSAASSPHGAVQRRRARACESRALVVDARRAWHGWAD
eukprot:scaffold22799_cov142-Isochrysis_galbana.AAC.4